LETPKPKLEIAVARTSKRPYMHANEPEKPWSSDKRKKVSRD